MAQPVVELKGITKCFAATVANSAVDLHCNQGEILCLLGENGAGKTTLMKILYGQYRPDAGEIWYAGKKVNITSPRDSIALGIQMVHQHFMLVPPLSVADNIVLGKEPRRHGLYNKKAAVEIVARLSQQYGLKVPPQKPVKDLSVGEQQRAEIIKALYQGANLLILDEPSAVLTPQEVEDLFVVMRRLKADGKSIIIITHKLKETMAISDRVCVLRGGKLAGERETAATNTDELSEMMVGRKIFKLENRHFGNSEVVMDLHGVKMRAKQAGSPATEPLKDVSFNVRKHEVVGIAGVEGNGQMEILGVLSGIFPKWEGEVFYQGRSIKGVPTNRLIEDGISVIHADRHQYSVAMEEKVPENFLLGSQDKPAYRKRKGILDWRLVNRDSEAMMTKYDVRPPSLQMQLKDFSGGNQQKFVVGREIGRGARFLIAAHPTRGVDISATQFIHKQIIELKEAGVGVLLISSDLDELMALSDRIAVLYDGRIVAFDDADKFNAVSLGKLMGGGADA